VTRISPLHQLAPDRVDTPPILKRLASASRQLAELKGVAASIPHQGILINTLGMQEAKDSSAIENIVTTHDELFRDDVFPDEAGTAGAKVDTGHLRTIVSKVPQGVNGTWNGSSTTASCSAPMRSSRWP
jgi:Fic family protein